MPVVSVILNCYNHEAYVAEAVDSVLAQTFTDFELILIDNGSTDGTRAILTGYTDSRIRPLLFDQNESLSKRLNQGVQAATGAFVCILYSDDMMLPDKLERQVAIFARLSGQYGVVYAPSLRFNHYTGVEWLCPSIDVCGDMMPAILDRFADGTLDMSSPLSRRQCFVEHPWHEDLFGDGEAVYLRIALNWKMHYDSQPNVRMRDHDTNIGKAIIKNHDMFIEICNRLVLDDRFPPEFEPKVRRLQAIVCRNSAWTALRMESNKSGWMARQFYSAIRNNPIAALHPRWIFGVGFLLVPYALRKKVNAAVRSLRGTKENFALMDDYGS